MLQSSCQAGLCVLPRCMQCTSCAGRAFCFLPLPGGRPRFLGCVAVPAAAEGVAAAAALAEWL